MTSCQKLWPPNDPSFAAVHWDMIAGKLLLLNGDAQPDDVRLDRPLLIAIRGAAPGDEQTHEMHARPAYDDSFVLVQKTTMPMLFSGATHSYQTDSKLSPDEDGDKRGDVGSIRPGRFVLTDKGAEPYPIFEVSLPDGSKSIPCWRDLGRHDGKIDDAEKERAETATKGRQVNATGFYSTAVLMHTGWDAPPDSPHRSSISCLTANHRHLEIMRNAAKQSAGKLDCILIDADELVAIVDALPLPDDEPTKPVTFPRDIA
jgi:hypothetical protein